MTDRTGFPERPMRLAFMVVALGLTAACEDGAAPGFLQPKDKSATAATASSGGTTKLVERDVESPEVFQVTEAGLWDGRPSLGGVWVAHPDVTDPERVIIRNAANNKFVIGALFRRERDIPGPRIQASSDAAVALGMLAGAPVQLNVTALRREEIAPEPEPEAAPEPVATEVAAAVPPAEPVEAKPLDPIAGAAAAIEASEPTGTADSDAIEAAVEAEPAPRKTPFKWPWTKRTPEPTAPLSAIDDIAATPEAATATVAAVPTPATPRASSLDKPFIQVGIFSVKANANSAADQIRKTGVVPIVYEQSTNGKTFWRVVVGPARNRSERATLLKKVQGVGFPDAYIVSN